MTRKATMHPKQSAKTGHRQVYRKAKAHISSDNKTLSVRVPLKLAHHAGRKQIVSPAGADPWRPRHDHADNALLKAVARAFRWRKLLETGVYSSIDEMAKAEKINPSYVSRVLRLTLLAPEIVVSILDGKDLGTGRAADLMNKFPVEWEYQLRETAGY